MKHFTAILKLNAKEVLLFVHLELSKISTRNVIIILTSITIASFYTDPNIFLHNLLIPIIGLILFSLYTIYHLIRHQTKKQ